MLNVCWGTFPSPAWRAPVTPWNTCPGRRPFLHQFWRMTQTLSVKLTFLTGRNWCPVMRSRSSSPRNVKDRTQSVVSIMLLLLVHYLAEVLVVGPVLEWWLQNVNTYCIMLNVKSDSFSYDLNTAVHCKGLLSCYLK